LSHFLVPDLLNAARPRTPSNPGSGLCRRSCRRLLPSCSATPRFFHRLRAVAATPASCSLVWFAALSPGRRFVCPSWQLLVCGTRMRSPPNRVPQADSGTERHPRPPGAAERSTPCPFVELETIPDPARVSLFSRARSAWEVGGDRPDTQVRSGGPLDCASTPWGCAEPGLIRCRAGKLNVSCDGDTRNRNSRTKPCCPLCARTLTRKKAEILAATGRTW